MATTEELACVYSALILQDGDVQVDAEKIQALLKAAKVDVEPFWPGLFAKACETLSLKDLVSNVGAGAGSGPAAAAGGADGGAPAAAAEEKKEEKKEEEEEEEDDDMGFGLFD